MKQANRLGWIRRLRFAATVLAACSVGCLLLYSCSTTQQVLLRRSGSGSVQFRVKMNKILRNAAGSLSQGGSSSTAPGQFDIPKIRGVFSKNPGLTLTSLASPSSGVLTGSFTFGNINRLFGGASSSEGHHVVTFSRNGSEDVLTVDITRGDFSEIAKLTGVTDNPLYQMFGPEQNAATSVSDLNQMMVYTLGNSGPAALEGSSINVHVKVDGTIISQTGGVRTGDTVGFHIPLVRLLLLKKPLDYSITFS